MTGLEHDPIELTRHCERSEAIQCCGAGLDCFVAPLLGRKCRSPAKPYLLDPTTLSSSRVGRRAGAELAMTALIPSDRKPGCSRIVGHRAMGDSVIMQWRYHV